jgi:hypothetical protein
MSMVEAQKREIVAIVALPFPTTNIRSSISSHSTTQHEEVTIRSWDRKLGKIDRTDAES